MYCRSACAAASASFLALRAPRRPSSFCTRRAICSSAVSHFWLGLGLELGFGFGFGFGFGLA